MRATVVYESMYGNTHKIAEAIGRSLSRAGFDVSVLPVGDDATGMMEISDLVVVGGPTHVHHMSSERTRAAALEAANKTDSELTMDPDAEGEGLREWFDVLPSYRAKAAAFDTRVDMAPMLTGRASKGISRRLRHCGFTELDDPHSFLVDNANTLKADQEAKALAWGEELATKMPRLESRAR